MVNIKINGIEYAVEEGTTILEACRQNGIRIPTLCWLKDINAIGACRICVVEMTGARSLVASCVYPLSKFDEGKNILTHSPAVLQSRKMTLQLLLSDHNMDCLACSRNGSCELQELCKELGVDDTTFFEGEKNEYDPMEIYRIVRFKASKKDRRIQWMEFKPALIGSAETKKRGYVAFTGHKYGNQSYLLEIPASEAEPGEYGIFYMSIITATAIPVGTFSINK